MVNSRERSKSFKTNFPVTPIIRYKQLTIWFTTGLFKMLK